MLHLLLLGLQHIANAQGRLAAPGNEAVRCSRGLCTFPTDCSCTEWVQPGLQHCPGAVSCRHAATNPGPRLCSECASIPQAGSFIFVHLEATDLVCRAAVAMLVSVLCARLRTCCGKEILCLAIKGACACGGAQQSLNSSQQQLHVFEETKWRGKKHRTEWKL